MSKVENDSFQTKYNQTITAADVNGKFTDIQTATNDGSPQIDSTNVRAEGIDRRNLGGTPQLQSIAVAINNKVDTTTAYTIDSIAGSGDPAIVRLTGAGTNGSAILDFGETITITGSASNPSILRLHYSINLEDSDGASDSLDASSPRGQRACMVYFPAYSTDGVNWNTFPNRTNWFAFDGGAGVDPASDGPKRDNTSGAVDKYELPRNDGNTVTDIGANFDDGICVITLDSFNGTGYRNAKPHGCLNFAPVSNLQLRYIGFFMVGPLMLSLASIYGTGRSFAAAGLGIDPIRIERANYTAMVFNPK
jgi:hypothetical protein